MRQHLLAVSPVSGGGWWWVIISDFPYIQLTYITYLCPFIPTSLLTFLSAYFNIPGSLLTFLPAYLHYLPASFHSYQLTYITASLLTFLPAYLHYLPASFHSYQPTDITASLLTFLPAYLHYLPAYTFLLAYLHSCQPTDCSKIVTEHGSFLSVNNSLLLSQRFCLALLTVLACSVLADQPFTIQLSVARLFAGPRCLWGPVYGSRSLYVSISGSFG